MRLIILTERLPDSMTLYLCLPLLAVLLKPAVCLYTCSSEYNRTPGGLTRSWITFNPLLNIMDFFLFLSLKQQMDHHLHKHLNLLFVALLQTIQTCQLTVAPVWSPWRSTCVRLSGQASTPQTWLWMGTTTPQTAWALSTPVWTLQSFVTSFLLTTVWTTPVASLCRSEEAE